MVDILPVPKGFNPKNYCGERVYEYALPVEILRPSPRHPQYDGISKTWIFDNKELLKVN